MARISIRSNDQINALSVKAAFVGTHTLESGRSIIYHGGDESEVLRKMCSEFAAEFIDTLPGVTVLRSHVSVYDLLKRLALTDDRATEVAKQIATATPREVERLTPFLTEAEIIRGYLRHNADESIEVVEFKPEALITYANRKPARVNVIHYDKHNRMAISRDLDDLIGFYQINDHDEDPHPDDYEWDNGFDFEYLSLDQAETLKTLGHTDIVEKFERRGAVSKG